MSDCGKGDQEAAWIRITFRANYSPENEEKLMGLMIDRAEINVEDGFVNLKLYKEFGK